MAKVKDFKIVDNDLVIVNGDFAISESDQQHAEDLIYSAPGHWKEYPLIGVGLDYYRNSVGKEQELRRAIMVQLEADKFNINDVIVLSMDQIYIDAERVGNL
jgi:hypothetical protein